MHTPLHTPLTLRGRWGRREVGLHVSLPLAVLAAGLLAGSTDAALGYGLIVLAHLGGHAVLARRAGVRASGLFLHALGGGLELREEDGTPVTRALVGLGGVPGQLALWLAVVLATRTGLLEIATDGVLYQCLTRLNLLLCGLNLLPLVGSDGRDLWALPGRVEAQAIAAQREQWQGLLEKDRGEATLPPPAPRAERLERLRADVEAELAARDALVDAGIPAEVTRQADALLAEVWTRSPRLPRQAGD